MEKSKNEEIKLGVPFLRGTKTTLKKTATLSKKIPLSKLQLRVASIWRLPEIYLKIKLRFKKNRRLWIQTIRTMKH